MTAPLAAVLGSLPTLSSLHAELRCADASFFAQLMQLSELQLDGRVSGAAPAALIGLLRHCSQLIRLSLASFPLTSAHLAELLPAFPRLSCVKLQYLSKLESLRCFATPALAKSLSRLELDSLWACPWSELTHLLGLRWLRFLDISFARTDVNREQHQAVFAIPSQRFPMMLSSSVR